MSYSAVLLYVSVIRCECVTQLLINPIIQTRTRLISGMYHHTRHNIIYFTYISVLNATYYLVAGFFGVPSPLHFRHFWVPGTCRILLLHEVTKFIYTQTHALPGFIVYPFETFQQHLILITLSKNKISYYYKSQFQNKKINNLAFKLLYL
jgi:hypothetical protein